MSSIKFYVKENGNMFSLSEMSEPESAAIAECAGDLLPYNKMFNEIYWLHADVCLFDEDDAEFGLLRCYTSNPTPKNGSMEESRIPYPIPQDVIDTLTGKTFHVTPRQLGLSPWGHTVEIVFESKKVPVPVPVPSGVKASTLITAALNQQRQAQ